MKRSGRGTGTLRARRLDRVTETWSMCQHRCSCGERWEHRVPPGITCKLGTVLAEGPCCLEWPLTSKPR